MTDEAKTSLVTRLLTGYKSLLDYSGTKTVTILYVDSTSGGIVRSNSLEI